MNTTPLTFEEFVHFASIIPFNYFSSKPDATHGFVIWDGFYDEDAVRALYNEAMAGDGKVYSCWKEENIPFRFENDDYIDLRKRTYQLNLNDDSDGCILEWKYEQLK